MRGSVGPHRHRRHHGATTKIVMKTSKSITPLEAILIRTQTTTATCLHDHKQSDPRRRAFKDQAITTHSQVLPVAQKQCSYHFISTFVH